MANNHHQHHNNDDESDFQLSERLVWMPLIAIAGSESIQTRHGHVLELVGRLSKLGQVLSFELRPPAPNKRFSRALCMFMDANVANQLRQDGLPRAPNEDDQAPVVMRVDPLDPEGYTPERMIALDRALQAGQLEGQLLVRIRQHDDTTAANNTSNSNDNNPFFTAANKNSALVYLRRGQEATWSIDVKNNRIGPTELTHVIPTPDLYGIRSPFWLRCISLHAPSPARPGLRPKALGKAGPTLPQQLMPGWSMRFELTVTIPEDEHQQHQQQLDTGYDCVLFFLTSRRTYLAVRFSARIVEGHQLQLGGAEIETETESESGAGTGGDHYDPNAHNAMLARQHRPRKLTRVPVGVRATRTHRQRSIELPMPAYECPHHLHKIERSGGSNDHDDSEGGDHLATAACSCMAMMGEGDGHKQRMHELLWLEEQAAALAPVIVGNNHARLQHEFNNTAITVQVKLLKSPSGSSKTDRLPWAFDPTCCVAKISRPSQSFPSFPSVLIDDVVLLWLDDGADEQFEGYVVDVLRDRLLVHFNQRVIQRGSGLLFGVPFTAQLRVAPNRFPYRAQHRAIDEIDSRWIAPLQSSSSSFPTSTTTASSSNEYELQQQQQQQRERCVCPLCTGLNTTQRAFVSSLTQQPNGIPSFTPVLLRGPARSGKTGTLCALVHQLLVSAPTHHVLICTPSNATADHYVEKLGPWCKKYHRPLFRVNNFDRHVVPSAAVRRFCGDIDDTGTWAMPTAQQLLDCPVVVCTCHSAATVAGVGVPAGHFSHIIVDDACQTFEADVLVAMQLATGTTRVILAGDNRQLGPRCRSSVARRHGFEVSVIERLLLTPRYDPHITDIAAAVNFELTEVYHTHPVIVELLSTLFYDRSLVARAPPVPNSSFAHCQLLVSRTSSSSASSSSSMPSSSSSSSSQVDRKRATFVHVKTTNNGTNESRTPTSPSWYNIDEIAVVAQVIADLCSDARTQIQPSHITVISPYHAQERFLRRHLHDIGMQDVRVVGPNDVRGVDAKVVVLTTVRNTRAKAEDLGFVCNPKLLNTAISAAREALVVVGDAFLLATDRTTRTLVKWFDAVQHAYNGPSFANLPVEFPPDDARPQQQLDCPLIACSASSSSSSCSPSFSSSSVLLSSPTQAPPTSLPSLPSLEWGQQSSSLDVLLESKSDSSLLPSSHSRRANHELIIDDVPSQPALLPVLLDPPSASSSTSSSLPPLPSSSSPPAARLYLRGPTAFPRERPIHDTSLNMALIQPAPRDLDLDSTREWVPLVTANKGDVVVWYQGAVANSVMLQRADAGRFYLLVFYLGRSCVSLNSTDGVEVRFETSPEYGTSTMASLALFFHKDLLVCINATDHQFARLLVFRN